jgi:hypothetical protein
MNMTRGIILYNIEPNGCHAEIAQVGHIDYHEIFDTYIRPDKEMPALLTTRPMCFRCENVITETGDYYHINDHNLCEACYMILDSHPDILLRKMTRLKDALIEERAKQINFMSPNDKIIMHEIWLHASVPSRLHMRDQAKRELIFDLEMKDIFSEA